MRYRRTATGGDGRPNNRARRRRAWDQQQRSAVSARLARTSRGADPVRQQRGVRGRAEHCRTRRRRILGRGLRSAARRASGTHCRRRSCRTTPSDARRAAGGCRTGSGGFGGRGVRQARRSCTQRESDRGLRRRGGRRFRSGAAARRRRGTSDPVVEARRSSFPRGPRSPHRARATPSRCRLADFRQGFHCGGVIGDDGRGHAGYEHESDSQLNRELKQRFRTRRNFQRSHAFERQQPHRNRPSGTRRAGRAIRTGTAQMRGVRVQ
jgi:hypothetical protein